MTALHVAVHGSGPPVLLLHGWAMHGGVFAPLVERLADDFTLHVVDLPGHGHSLASATPLALEAVVSELAARVPRALWLGWSLGGLFALHAAATRPRAVSGLALLCASPRFVRGDDWKFGMSAELFADFADGLRRDWRGTLERFIALEAFGSEHAKEELRALRDGLFARGEPATQALADGLELLQATDLRAVLPRLSPPSLWLAGRRDRVVDPRAMRAAAERAPRARFEQVEHAGHAPFLTHAGTVADALRRFSLQFTRSQVDPP